MIKVNVSHMMEALKEFPELQERLRLAAENFKAERIDYSIFTLIKNDITAVFQRVPIRYSELIIDGKDVLFILEDNQILVEFAMYIDISVVNPIGIDAELMERIKSFAYWAHHRNYLMGLQETKEEAKKVIAENIQHATTNMHEIFVPLQETKS